jgi:spore coat protein U-like protein
MQISRIAAYAGAVAALLGQIVLPAQALQTVTAQFNVTATVLDNCAVAASDLAFGNYSASTATPVTATTSISVTCTANLAYAVALDGGTTTGQVTDRAMTDGSSHQLTYGLYTSGSYSTLWGDGTGSSATVPGTGTGSAQSLTVYGRIPAAQYVAAGSYADRVTVTVSY